MNPGYGLLFLTIFAVNTFPANGKDSSVMLATAVIYKTNEPLKEKPEWFWNQPADCGMTSVGLSRHSVLYPDNSREEAFEAGLHSYLHQLRTDHSGGQAFSVTERGAVWLGGDQQEAYDTTQIAHYRETLSVLDHQVINNMDVMLLGPESCQADADRARQSTPIHQTPDWVQDLPSTSGYLYATGISEGYFYPHSSWRTAEATARRNLSASIESRVRGLHDQQIGVSAEVLYADLTVTLNNAVIVSRYHDPATNLYYVLIRMPVR